MLEGQLDGGVGILLAYDCYLRPTELCAIRLEDVIFQDQEGVEVCNALILPKTKRGINQSVVIRPFFLQVLVARLFRRQMAAVERTTAGPHKEFLFNFKERGLRKLLHEAIERLNIQHLGLTPRAFRSGAASQDAADRALPYAEIKARGRWHNDKSLHRYLQPGRLLAQLNSINQHTRQEFAQMVAKPHIYFPTPKIKILQEPQEQEQE